MKKLILSLIILLNTALFAYATEMKNIDYKNIKPNTKLIYMADIDRWDIAKKKDDNYFVKQISVGTGNYSEFYTRDGNIAFSTGCTYEFIHKGDLIGYSNQDLKFYDFTLIDNELIRRELRIDEVKALFPDFRIIEISEFSQNTHSFKVKKDKLNQKFIILNDTDINFYHYSYTSGNAKFYIYPLSGFIEVTKKGMIQFSHFGENSENFPWFILLVR